MEIFHNTANETNTSALVYSISETANPNNLRPYYYFKYILAGLPKRRDKQWNIDPVAALGIGEIQKIRVSSI